MAVEKGAVVEVDQGAAAAAKEVAGGDMITLKSSDGKTFEVSKEAAERLSKFLKEKIAGGSIDGGIQLEKIGSEALEKVVDYFNKHADSDPSGISFVDTAASEELKEWDRKLVDGLRMGAFFDLVQAADYLGMAGLVDVTCRKLADMMKGKTPVQIREMFNIKNDYTPEQEEEVRRENAWAFDEDED